MEGLQDVVAFSEREIPLRNGETMIDENVAEDVFEKIRCIQDGTVMLPETVTFIVDESLALRIVEVYQQSGKSQEQQCIQKIKMFFLVHT